ncbi:hypothetical protein H112_01951 [Trichophyton rubrum D6]|uniref:Transcription factor domain-containing protein n=3 Tax=Trichophyton TaxID=5550 RepID=F2SVZ7_TRIRC|nr:uncharacterized protein TERG_06718 [Trichophyton rubrum CBS 118892]EZF25755.1 hypothetical protein H100_01947 [Trichophyton rubrum MR850]EZF44927.1 hypothetical protein H102_01946 [Trichophyton rubrum CBS 100081]EZF55580.1 hypothetical protein H103_01957 [Trichophyton rubrum CBS 288.86]EZF66160.1 hypothetical protein H104_01932 [Trichophyton rubrum CBS 289.86]EZF76780.1 hypothetical protein H105_01961 [Trichophyton soudanense CBS 452.61]EZF87376.1 hypothetical protein H110_01956 [Trichophy
MRLSWQPAFSLFRKPVRRRRARKVERGLLRDTEKPQQFEFIFEHSIIESETADTPLTTNFTLSGVPVEHITNGQSQDKESIEEIAPYAETPFETYGNESPVIQGEEASHNLDLIDRPAEPHQHQNNGKNPYTVLLLTESTADRQLQPCKKSTGTFDRRLSPLLLDRGSLHSFLEFCKIPLTSDLRINPFRYRKDLEPEPTFLVHAVMALAGHYVHSASTQDHRHAAFQLIREKLGSYNNTEDVYSMLDAVIILFSLDETQSAFGNWNTHLLGVYGLLEACDGIGIWAASTRATAQVAILTWWWDAITCLVSREDCVFPYAYSKAVLSKHDGQEWDYFGLCGYPLSLVHIIMQSARLCAEKRKSSSMQCATFDTIILEIEQLLESWDHTSPATAIQDEKVFQWKLGSSVPLPILYRARAITDHVFACRDISMVSRRALLPLFFAGCELRDQSLRSKIVEFCCIWDRRIRYHMFSNTIPLLEEVWVEQAVKGFENVWWGQ